MRSFPSLSTRSVPYGQYGVMSPMAPIPPPSERQLVMTARGAPVHQHTLSGWETFRTLL